MASTTSDSSPGAARWRSAQRGLTTLLLRDLRGLRRLINPRRLQATVPPWIEAVAALVGQYAEFSAGLAADFYDAEREAAAVPGVFTVPVADPPPSEQTTESLRWATKDVWDRDTDNATVVLDPVDVRIETAMKKAEGVVDRLVLNVGRDTVLQAVREDPQAVAWARGAALGCCSFCALMASRGATYHTAGTAGRDANERFNGDTGQAKFHNWCRCVVIPVYRGQAFELSPHAAAWDELYKEHAQGHPGDQLRLFRRAFVEHQRSLGRPT